ncbi:MAG: hypothetical protein AAFN92_06095 [Bacteroidota bacterium]
MADPITATAVATSLITLISQNETVKKLGSDFVTTITETVRPWFLIDDDPVVETAVAEVVQVNADQPLSPLAGQVLKPKLINYLEAHPEALQQLTGLVRQGQEQLAAPTLNQSKYTIDNRGAKIGVQNTDTKVSGDLNIHLPKEE